MPAPILQSVPNVSVGRDIAVVDALAHAVRDGIQAGAALDGSRAQLADVHRDSDHDRSVLTIVGSGEALAGGLEALARASVKLIDLREHGFGVHPRIGALDVLPIIALDPADEDARDAAHALVMRLASLLGDELLVPVIRYGLDAAGVPIPGACRTGEVRSGGPEAVATRVASGDLVRIAGPVMPHESAGMTIAGVRDVLVAFNVDLDVDDIDIARSIAARIRATSSSGDALPGVRALGLRLASRRIAQVSTNIEEHRSAGPARVLEAIVRIAAEHGVGVSAAELVGLAPDPAVVALRYACNVQGVTLLAADDPSLDHAIAGLA